jgi:hypothetical protein
MPIHWHVCSLALFSWIRTYFWLHLTLEMAVCITFDAIIIVEPYASDRINLTIIVNGHYQSRVQDYKKHVRPNAMAIWSRSELIHIHTHIRISLIHHTAWMATWHQTSHLTPYITNIQSTVNIIQFKNHNYVYIKIKFKIAKTHKFMTQIYFFWVIIHPYLTSITQNIHQQNRFINQKFSSELL